MKSKLNELELSYNGYKGKKPCALCNKEVILGLPIEMFIRGTKSPVCWDCARPINPDLLYVYKAIENDMFWADWHIKGVLDRAEDDRRSHERKVDMIKVLRKNGFTIEEINELTMSHLVFGEDEGEIWSSPEDLPSYYYSLMSRI